MFNSILIVCVGNICRSPMAEYQLRKKLELIDVNTYVSSAGLSALVGYGADKNAIEVMAERGLDGSSHRARQLDDNLVKQNELILVMEYWQQKDIEHLYPYARGRVHLLGKWDNVEISDPYKKPKQAFIEAYEKIDKACEEWCRKI